jgi:outer membrane protein, multidrug efflux system
MRRVSLLILLMLAAAGCVTKKPPTGDEIRGQSMGGVVVTNEWKAGAAAAGTIQDNWLAGFNDETLSALVVEALTNNPDLRVASARVEQSAAYLGVARAQLRPAINLLGTTGLKMGGASDLSSALQGLMLGASWELDLWGRVRYSRNAAREDYASVQSDYEFARQSMAATVSKGWFLASATRLQQSAAEEMVRSAEEMVKLSEKRQSIGAGNEQDVVMARANLGTFRDSLQQFKLAHEQSLRSLELLLGRYPEAELEARKDLPGLPGPVPVGMPLEMLERRPDMVAAERRVAAAFNRVGEAKAARLPRLSLNASVALIESDVIQLKDDYENPSAGAGAKLLAPIYQGGALKAQVEIRTAEQKAAVADYARMALRAIGDVEGGLAASATLAERERLLKDVVRDQEKALELANTAYRIGNQDLRNVLQQQVSLQQARITLFNVQNDQLSQRVNLHLILGGSFEQRPAEPQVAAKGKQ